MAKILIVEHATRIVSLIRYRCSFMMTGMELHISAFHSSPTQLTLSKEQSLLSCWFGKRNEQAPPRKFPVVT
jgi:hypothetical protein